MQHRKLRQYWQNVLKGGEMAAQTIEHEKKLGQRIKERFM